MKNPSGSDRRDEFDVKEAHSQLLREKAEPSEAFRAAPAWLKHAIYAPLVIWGLMYLLNGSGGFRWNEYHEGTVSTLDLAERAELNRDRPEDPDLDATPSFAEEELR